MRTVSIRLADLDRGSIPVGFAGENQHTQVRIDCKKAYEEYPTAVVSLTVKNPHGDAYPAATIRENDIVAWNVTNADLAYDGTGEIQLTFTVGEVVKKSYIGKIRIEKSILNPGEAPDPIQNWIDQANAILEEVEDAVPEGGTTGQVLAKKSNADRDTEWVDQTGGGTSDYDELENRPQIAGVTLTGDVSLHDLGAAAESDIPDVSGFYTKPSGGIPDTDLASGVQTSLGKADSAYQKPSGGIPSSDMASAVQTSLGKADTAYQKPSGGIPASDMASGAIPDPTSIIDDTAGDGATNKTWSADKLNTVKSAINSKMDEPSSEGTAGQFLQTDGQGGRTWATPSGGGGTSDYSDLTNKPQINGITLSGNKTSADLGIGVVETVSGSTPSITGVAGHRYICGECATLAITAPASGCIDVLFESGSTATVLTVTSAKTGVSAIKWANGFDPSSLEASKTYELNILDGELGVALAWT